MDGVLWCLSCQELFGKIEKVQATRKNVNKWERDEEIVRKGDVPANLDLLLLLVGKNLGKLVYSPCLFSLLSLPPLAFYEAVSPK